MASTPRTHHKIRTRKSHSIDNNRAIYLQPSVCSAELPHSAGKGKGESGKKNERIELLRRLFEVDRGELVDALIQAIGARRGALPQKIGEANQERRDLAASYLHAVRASMRRAKA
jgi:hypothetical protein